MTGSSTQDIRIEIYNGYREVFASAPIRLMSRTVSAMRSLGYDDLASAIGDLDWRTVPADDPVDPGLRDEWRLLLETAFGHAEGWLRQLSPLPLSYNLDSVGYPAVTRAWAEMWARQLGIEFVNRAHDPAEVVIFHGGNQAVQACLIGIAEAARERCGSGHVPTMLLPIPTFSCPMDQIALQGMRVCLLPPSEPGTDPSAIDVGRVPDGVDVDGVYLMPVNNPTGRTLPPEKLRAFLEAILERWPHAGIVLDSVYVRMHPQDRQLVAFYEDDGRFADSILFIDSLSKTHGVTGLRAGAVLSRSRRLRAGVIRYAQNVMAGPSNMMQAVVLGLLAPFLTGDPDLAESRIRLQRRIGRHLQRRRQLLLEQIFESHRHLLAEEQPLLPDPVSFDWPGSMYADLHLAESCRRLAERRQIPPTVAFYLETGVAGVPLEGFCWNRNLERHGLLINGGDPELTDFVARAANFVRLSFGMTPPPRT